MTAQAEPKEKDLHWFWLCLILVAVCVLAVLWPVLKLFWYEEMCGWFGITPRAGGDKWGQ